MDAIKPVTNTHPLVAAPADVRPVAQAADRGTKDARVLPPAATFDVARDAPPPVAETKERRGYERDAESQALVYRVIDAVSGSVIVQIPDEIVIKARAYAQQDTGGELGTAVEKRA